MPIYEDVSADCAHHFEELIFSDEQPLCPKCENANAEKQLSTFAAIGSPQAERGQAALLEHADHRLRELVAHQAWIPHLDLRFQVEAVSKLEPPRVRERALLWLSRRTTSQKTLTLEDIDAYWTSRDS